MQLQQAGADEERADKCDGVTARQLQLCQSKDEQWSTNERGSKGRDDEKRCQSVVPARVANVSHVRGQVSKQFDDIASIKQRDGEQRPDVQPNGIVDRFGEAHIVEAHHDHGHHRLAADRKPFRYALYDAEDD